MRVPVSWLREYVDFDATPAELADKLTFSGLEVEAIETVGADLPGIVVAEIRNILPHPNANKLLLCDVNTGDRQLRVVCGAKNFKVGDKVACATVGTVMPNGMKIEEATLRGELSHGMLCAEDELGISGDHGGLMILPANAVPGAPFSSIVPPEPVLVIEVTPNRSDCLSIIGIAREVAALYGSTLKLPSATFVESDEPIDTLANVEVKDSAKCPRYNARVLRNIVIAPAPLWMRLRLTQAGIRPINNIVDITNYVMLEYGQPLHAFDRTLLKDGRVVVRRAKQGEPMTTLDGAARKLSPDMLVIADSEKPVALAGVMGGAGSEIRAETREVLLESASFAAAGIRKTSKAIGLSTESSYRFERGVDIGMTDTAGRRAASLMTQHAGATVARGVIDVFPRKPRLKKIRCRFARISNTIGVELSIKQVTSILESLDLKIDKVSRTSCSVLVPSFRGDLEIEADLIEEVARMHGLDKLPVRAPRSSFISTMDDSAIRATQACRKALSGLGLSEIVNYSFVSEKLLDLFDVGNRAQRVVLPNPVSADYSSLRPSLIPQMVATLGYNLSRQAAETALFEIGTIYTKDSTGKLHETQRLSIGLLGPIGRGGLDKRRPVEADEVFLWIKGILESLCVEMHAPALVLSPAKTAWSEAGKTVEAVFVSGDRPVSIGVLAVVSPALRSEWRMARPIAVMELDLHPLISGVYAVPAVKPLAVYPCVTRDIAIILDAKIRNDDVLQIIRKAAPPELTHIDLFDIFSGEGVGSGKKSLAYSLTYRSLERTLTDDEANELNEAVKSRIVNELKAEVRER